MFDKTRVARLTRATAPAALALCLSVLQTSAAEPSGENADRARAQQILDAAGVQGGLIVHLGCGDGRLTAGLLRSKRYLVHGLDTDVKQIGQTRTAIARLEVAGRLSVDSFDGKRLPYIDNLVNLLVVEQAFDVPRDEMLRVVAPGSVVYLKENGQWTRIVKPRPATIDDWTHYLHDASNNAVAHDTVVGPPRRMQWMGSPRYCRHHDRMSSLSAAVSAGGRVFYVFDEAPPASILSPPRWNLVARDAFNGVVLWKRRMGRWHTHLWPLKSGPAQLPRRLVAQGDRVYATLSIDGPLVALDAATGKTIRTYEQTRATEEAVLHDGVLFLLVDNRANALGPADAATTGRAYGAKFWDEQTRRLMAVRADTGQTLWDAEYRVLPGTLAADARHAVFHDGQSVVCLDRNSGKPRWRSEPVERAKEIRSFYVPILVLYDDVVLFSGGETAGLQTGSWYTSGEDTLTALSADDGKQLWTAYHPPSGYRSPEDLLVVDGLVWTGETTSGRAVGHFSGRDPRTGEVKREFTPNLDTYWFHHRCYRGKATDNYLLMARAGTEFVDVRKQEWIPHHWFRGACLYGIMPANGLVYAPQHPCACYLESKLYGFNALAPASTGPRVTDDDAATPRLEKGPAFVVPPTIPSADAWPTFRHDNARSGRASTRVAASPKTTWQAELGGKLTSPVIADGTVVVASIDTHTVHALGMTSGKRLWQFTAGGRVDSPPTIHEGRVLFGSADGWVYCLSLADGALSWRFRAAPIDQRLTAFEQVESVWPVHGSVLVQDGVAYVVAGRSMFLDGGVHLWRLDPTTGRVLSHAVLNNLEEGTGKDLQDYVSWLNMPVGLTDVLSSDGKLVYMRSQPFDLEGNRLPLQPMPNSGNADGGAVPAVHHPEHAHLFSPTGLLDDTWWHRTYWVYGSQFVSGWCGYFLAGKTAPAGRILVFDDTKVYGFGRKPQYFRWTTPIEHQLFAADKIPPTGEASKSEPVSSRPNPGGSRVRVEKSASLDPTGKPLALAAWVKADKPGGVVAARGGGGAGFTLYLQGGRPHFAVRSEGKLTKASGKTKVVGRWVHLAGVLGADRKLELFVDGKSAALAEVPVLIGGDPHEPLEIGADESSVVGDYTGPFGLTGSIDEVRLYRRALSADEISRLAGTGDAPDDVELVLSYSFDKPDAKDASGNANHGTVEGALPAEGKIGRALRFAAGPPTVARYEVAHDWAADLPLFARAMVLAEGVLFVAGPADMVDENEAFRGIDDPEVRRRLAEQAAVFAGRRGAVLRAVSAADGRTLAEQKLDACPVFDGMAAAVGRLYMTTTDGRVLCLK